MLTYTSTTEAPVRPKRIHFGLLSADEVRRVSVVSVTDTTLYYRGLPNSGGLLDPLMGSVDRRHLCASCMKDARTCQGHAGHIELAYPMYHTGFVDTVMKVLRTVCFACSRVCMHEEEVDGEARGKTTLASMHSTLRVRKTCPHCGMSRPTYSRTALGIQVDWASDTEWESPEERDFCTAPFTAREALSILEHVNDSDCRLLGFDPDVSHPKHMILQVLVVPPPCTRPAIYSSEGSKSRGQNDLTMKLLECLRRSNELETEMGGNWKTVDVKLTTEVLERISRLQYEVFSLVTGTVRGCKPPISRGGHHHTQKALADRLKGKEGRVRGNLMGKRVDFSARAVITPDPYFACDRVGVPYDIARTLTIPERVNPLNVVQLTKRVRLGSHDVRGAQSVIHRDGSVTNLENCRDRDKLVLCAGDVVERNLDDEDVVVFNRQPSLHKHSMQAHRVRLIPGHTFALSLVVAAPYNADFDGDEMNVHVPQSVLARAECASLLSVPQNVVGPQSNKPTMGIVQDSLLGLHLLTLPDTLLDHKHTCRILGATLYADRTLPPPCLVVRRRGGGRSRLWSGRQIFSTILPRGLYMEPDNLETLEDDKIVVRDGNMLWGTLRKMHVGTAAGGIVDVIAREFGGFRCCRFFDEAQRLTHSFLLIRGHNVGVNDVLLSKDGHARVEERLAKATRLCEEIQREVDAGDVPPDAASGAESAVLRLLSKTLMQAGGIVHEHMDETNAIRRMVTAGSKGTSINLSQICAALGQQSLEGGRIRADKGGRALPYFAVDDHSLASRGFVSNSYALGLSPTELFFHSIGGREGLVDTAVKTSQTGYLQRRMNKSFEDHMVHQGGTIQNALGEVVAFLWGSDGMHPAKLERVRLEFLKTPKREVVKRMTEEEARVALEARRCVLNTKTHVLVGEEDVRVLLPFNPLRVRARTQRARDAAKGNAVSAEEATRSALQLASGLPSVVAASVIDLCCADAMRGVDEEAHREILAYLSERIHTAIAPKGESVGCIAAQSTGEPTMQMSASHSTLVLVAIDGELKSTPIGPLVDAYLPPIRSDDQHDVMPVLNLECPGVSSTEKVAWARITHLSRHPANGDMLTIETKRGRKLKMTASHSFLVRNKNRIVQRAGSDLVLGDCLPILKDLATHAGVVPPSPVPLTRATGRFIGAIVSEGTVGPTDVNFHNTELGWLTEIVEAFGRTTDMRIHVRKYKQTGLGTLPMMMASVKNKDLVGWMAEHFGRTSFNKTLPAWILDAPDEFVTGLLQTYFDGDGNVQTEAGQHRLCCHSVSTELVTMICLCLARYGIVTYVGKETYRTPAGAPGTIHRIIIPMSFAAKFQEHVGFSIEQKVQKLAQVVREQEAVGMRGFQAHIPGMNEVLEEVRSHIPPGGDKNSFETLLRKEFRRIQRKTGITPKMLMRCREHAVKFHAPDELVAELDQAIDADVWWDPIVSIEIEKDSKEMVYDFTVDEKLQSFMLSNGVFVHNTLNSVDWNTSMAIHWTGSTPPPAPHDAEVGAFIDALINERSAECQLQPDGKTVYLPLAPGTAVALSPDEDGRMMWTELEAVTRHPPINKDGSNTLVRVTTDSGRTVTVTKGKSLLVERGGKLVEKCGDEVTVGDKVPVVQELPAAEHHDTLDLHTVFRETEAVFTNTMIEAMEATKNDRQWFIKGGFKNRSCYSRSDIMRDAIKHRPALLEPNQVVWPHGGNFFPMRIPLDREFGFFVGAYLAEGCVTDHQVHVANVDPEFRDAARVWPVRHGIKSHETKEEHKNNGTSISIMFHSTILVQLMVRTCGKLSAGKRVPGFAFAAPDDFVRGLIDGYISGDGSISEAMITASSRSEKLRDGVALLLTRFGIGCRMGQYLQHSHVRWTTEDDGTRTQAKYGDVAPVYTLAVNAEGTRRFAEEIGLVIAHKRERCTSILDDTQAYKVSKRYSTMRDVRLEEIVALNDVESSHEFVYDLTVAHTRNMVQTSGLGCRDTFHFAGCASKNVTLGIPRLKELIDASRNPKTPCTTVRFRAPYGTSQAFAGFFANTLPLTRLSDVVSRCDILEATETLDILGAVPEGASRYDIHMCLHREAMRERVLTPPSIRKLLRQRLCGRAIVASSETNDIEWIVRVRPLQMGEMIATGGLSLDQEATLCHRVAHVLLESVVVGGHPGVSSANAEETCRVTLCPVEEVMVHEPEHVVHAYGTFLVDCAASPVVDWTRCTSNDIWETYQTLGIEACAHVLFDQIKTVISFDGQYVDDRHLSLVVDTMCRTGRIVPLNRHGINRTDSSPLMRASFEETIDVLCDAAVFAEAENARGVTTSIMTGQLAQFGSGAADVLLHESMLAPVVATPVLVKSSVRVLRSRCRSFVADAGVERAMEYVPVDSMAVRNAPASPNERRRVRFRPASPT